MKKGAFIFILLVVISSCRKDVKLKLPNYQQKVVVEASIETGQPAFVLLSYSVPYFGDFDLTHPETVYIQDGLVTITDGTTTETLTKITFSNVPIPIYIGSTLIGTQGKTYTLSVNVKNNTYTSVSTILTPAKLDSVYFKGEKDDSLGLIWAHFSEPSGLGDCYQWSAKRISKDFFYAFPFNSAFEDKFIDGKSFDFAYDRGPQPYNIQSYRDDPEQGYFKVKDTVVVKFSKIGRKEYDFWNTYYQNKASNSNPFSAPSNVKGTFGNDLEVLGAFVAYSPSFDTLVIKGK
ncbi:MAG: DUF4249 family protein [Bacteroidota bacterium]|nr:DUF4249 family protein [Bacteroidota bacterium]